MIITIDGPSASGKSTIARMLANKLGFYYISSGLLFRGLAYALVHEYRYQEENLINPRPEHIEAILDRFKYNYDLNTHEQLFFDNKNITSFLKNPKISTYASLIGTNLDVRNALAQLQRIIADNHNIIAEGRDMGSAIFPHADLKLFLTASLDVRAQRYQKDQHAKGRAITLEQAIQEIKDRDERDANRILAPLAIAQGAIIIDDSELSQQEVVDRILLDLPEPK